jgi:microcystin-dependent protein
MTSHLGRCLLGAAAASLTLLATAPGAHAGTEPYLGEIMYTIGSYCPKGWANADGRLLQVKQNAALFSLLSSKFGGDGITTFALPDLRGRTVVGAGGNATNDAPLGSLARGAKGGAESTTLTMSQSPMGTTAAKGAASGSIASAAPTAAVPIQTMPPWIGLTACIATTGLYRQMP